jgi:hypothetical protein
LKLFKHVTETLIVSRARTNKNQQHDSSYLRAPAVRFFEQRARGDLQLAGHFAVGVVALCFAADRIRSASPLATAVSR